jgi:hypothetical protein
LIFFQVEASIKNLTERGESEPSQKVSSNKIVLTFPSPDHAGLSTKSMVAYSEDKGRFLVAADDILPGELVSI